MDSIEVLVIPARGLSVLAIIKFAINPQFAEIQPYIRPAMGFLPTPIKAIAASGGIMTEQVSDARFPKVPINAIA